MRGIIGIMQRNMKEKQETDNAVQPHAEHFKKTKKPPKPPEKRLFHRPVTTRKVIVYALLLFLAVILAWTAHFVYVAVLHPASAFGNPPAQPTPGASPSPGQTMSPEEAFTIENGTGFMKDRVNILLVGIDYTDERGDTGRTDFRTDTIMLMCVDFATGRVDMLSVPRDSYADIAWTDERWKINGAYMTAGGKDGRGFECLMQTVSTTLGGIPVNYYVAVEMEGLKDIVDALGGVWYDVDYEIELDDVHLYPGYQLLDGEQALQYCRARKNITSGTDIDRIDRQQRFLLDVFSQLKEQAKLTDIPKLYEAVSDEVYTNLNLEQIAALSVFMTKLDADTDIGRNALTGEYLDIFNATYYVLDHTYTVQAVHEIFGDNVKLSIDWTYSLDYLQGDKDTVALVDAMIALRDYVNTDATLLQALADYPVWTELNELLDQADEQIDEAQALLEARETDEMKQTAKALRDTLKSLKALVKAGMDAE